MEGAGKYDDECTIVREMTEGETVAVIVINGDRGSGFSLQTTEVTPMNVLADVLESMAKELRQREK